MKGKAEVAALLLCRFCRCCGWYAGKKAGLLVSAVAERGVKIAIGSLKYKVDFKSQMNHFMSTGGASAVLHAFPLLVWGPQQHLMYP